MVATTIVALTIVRSLPSDSSFVCLELVSLSYVGQGDEGGDRRRREIAQLRVGRQRPNAPEICGSLAAFGGGDVGLVARSVGQRPPRGSELVAHHVAAGGERCRDASLRLLVRHPYCNMDRAAAVRARLVHLLEPE